MSKIILLDAVALLFFSLSVLFAFVEIGRAHV